MKNRHNILLIFFLLVIYLQAVATVTHTSLFDIPLPAEEVSSSEVLKPWVIKHAFSHAQSQKILYSGWGQKAEQDNNILLGYWPLIVTAGHWVKTAYDHFRIISGELVWNSRKTVLIFPFHTFW